MSTAKVMATKSIVGKRIESREGIYLGRIERLMLDVTEGRIAFALVRFAGPLGLGDGLYPLPWEALAPSRYRRRFVLDVDRDLLESAPTFPAGDAPEASSPEFALRITDHYGLERRAS